MLVNEFVPWKGFVNINTFKKYLWEAVIVDYRKWTNFNLDNEHESWSFLYESIEDWSFSMDSNLIDKKFRAIVVEISRIGCWNNSWQYLIYVSDPNVPNIWRWVHCDYEQIVWLSYWPNCDHWTDSNDLGSPFYKDHEITVCKECWLHIWKHSYQK